MKIHAIFVRITWKIFKDNEIKPKFFIKTCSHIFFAKKEFLENVTFVFMI